MNKRATAFLFPAATDGWLAILRVGLGLHLALYCLSLQSSWSFFLSGAGEGLITREFGEALVISESRLIPRLGWLVAAGEWLGVPEQTTLSVTWFALLIAACCLIAGILCRPSAIAAWFLHLCVAKSAGLLSYGVDNLMTIGLFYLALSPIPDRHALDCRIWSTKMGDPHILGFFRRVLQLHLCIIYFFGGLTKALGNGWWNGDNIWRALTRPPFDILPSDLVASWAPLLPAVGISAWLIELLYPALIWPQKTRLLWLALICLMHLGIGVLMGMHLFALVMIVLNVAAFGPAAAAPAAMSSQREPARC